MKRYFVVPLVVLSASLLIAAGKSTTRPTSAFRLTQPWGKISTLTEPQREQIFKIHVKTRAAINQLEAQERKDILALLNDEQKLELVQIDEGQTVAKKISSAAARNPTTSPATQPARDEESRVIPERPALP